MSSAVHSYAEGISIACDCTDRMNISSQKNPPKSLEPPEPNNDSIG